MALTKGQKSAAEKNRLYWEQRELEQKKHYITEEKEYHKHLNKIYEDMRDNVQKEIEAFYGKYAKAEGISLSEAKKRVSQLDIEAYERKAKRYVENKDFSKEANEEMRLYNATMKINRLEMLKANIGLELISGHEELQKYMESILQGRTEDELKRQAGILGETIKDNAKAAHAIVNASFHNAKYSDRIWMHQDILKAELSKQLQSGLIQGKNPRVLAKNIRQKFDVSKASAETLMRTELARVQTEAQKLSFERNGFEQYTFLALGDACGICKELNDKHFYVKDMMPGTNAPPMHPNCRCSTSAYEDGEEYDKWLEHLEKGGTTEEWQKLKIFTNVKIKQTGGKETGGKNYKPFDKDDKKDVAAAKEYRKISRINDTKVIANNTGFTEKEIKQIKRHLFFNKHKKYDGYGLLAPDYDIAVAWNRLRSGNYEKRDITLLKHELLESKMEKRYNLTIAEAHKLAKKEYDWEKELIEAVGESGEKDGLL